MSDPMVVFCTTCKGRASHLEQTLPRNLWDNSGYDNCRFVVLDYNSLDHLSRYLQERCRAAINSGRLIIYGFPAAEKFRMAHAKNMAHRLGIAEGADILVNLDADNFTGPDFAQYVADHFKQHGDNSFLWAKMLPGVLDRGISGRIAVSKQAFVKAGGYDEKYDTWGRDDRDFNERLRRLGCCAHEIDPKYLQAVRHNDKLRFKEYPHARSLAAAGEDEIESSISDATIANCGKIGIGTVYRNFDPKPIDLKPLPTRIFGIGMHKTATTSLHTALKILGYDSAHWKSAHWAKAIWHEMQEGRSRTLERHYALSDLPFAILYKELDLAYPGSKFILTVREEAAWLRSVQNHWNPDRNRYRAAWDTDPFTHRLHREVYGQKNFDADVFLARYRQHCGDVLRYFWSFGNPENALLVMNMDGGSGWPDLCHFLRQPIPSVPYPKEFSTLNKD